MMNNPKTRKELFDNLKQEIENAERALKKRQHIDPSITRHQEGYIAGLKKAFQMVDWWRDNARD